MPRLISDVPSDILPDKTDETDRQTGRQTDRQPETVRKKGNHVCIEKLYKIIIFINKLFKKQKRNPLSAVFLLAPLPLP